MPLTATVKSSTLVFDLQAAFGGGNWIVAASGYKHDGITPLILLYNRSNFRTAVMEKVSGSWVAIGSFKNNLRTGNPDFLVGGAFEDATLYHRPASYKIQDGLIIIGAVAYVPSVSDNHTVILYSTDYGATWIPVNVVGTSSPYINYVRGNLAFSDSGAAWNLTVDPLPLTSNPTRVRAIISDYEGQGGASVAQGGEWYRNDFIRTDTSTNNWAPIGFRRLHNVTRAGAHAHCGIRDLLILGDAAANETFRYSIAGGFDNYATGEITISTFEPQGVGNQPVSGCINSYGNAILAVDVGPGICLEYIDGGSVFFNNNNTRNMQFNGGSDALILEVSRGNGVADMYFSGYTAYSGSVVANAADDRMAVSKDGREFAFLADFPVNQGPPNDPANTGQFPKPVGPNTIVYTQFVSGVSAELYEYDIEIKNRSEQGDYGPGGTNLLASLVPTITQSGDASASLLNLIMPGFGQQAYYVYPAGTSRQGQRLLFDQPGTGSVYYLKGDSGGAASDVTFSYTGALSAGDYIFKFYVCAAEEQASNFGIQLVDGSGGALATSVSWQCNRINQEWQELYCYASFSGTTGTPQLVFTIAGADEFLIQLGGLFKQKLVPIEGEYTTAVVAPEVYTFDLPDSQGSALVRARVLPPTEAYGLGIAGSGEIELLRAEQDANNYVSLTYTPNGTIANKGTYTLKEVVAGSASGTDTTTAWLNMNEDITLAISYFNEPSAFNMDVEALLSSGDTLSLSSLSTIAPVSIKSGDVKIRVLQNDSLPYVQTASELQNYILQDPDLNTPKTVRNIGSGLTRGFSLGLTLGITGDAKRTIYNMPAVVFDGSVDYFRGSVTSLGSTNRILISAWIKPTAGSAVVQVPYGTAQGALVRFHIETLVSNSSLSVRATESGGTFGDIVNYTTANNALTYDAWNHVLAYIDSSSNQVLEVFINDVQVNTGATPGTNPGVLKTAAMEIGNAEGLGTWAANLATNRIVDGSMGDIWVAKDVPVLSLLNTALRRKFIDKNGLPVYLGIAGELPISGVLPFRYHSGFYPDYAVNKGTSTALPANTGTFLVNEEF